MIVAITSPSLVLVRHQRYSQPGVCPGGSLSSVLRQEICPSSVPAAYFIP